MPLTDLYDTNSGFLKDDTCIIEATIRRVPDYWKYDSKKLTGSVGIKNPGPTSYMNPLLQILFHIPKFRKAVLCITNGSIPLALQTLFYMLQYNETCVDTEQLSNFVTQFFEGDNYYAFMHHDVHQLSRFLLDKLEDSMKGSAVEGTIRKLFEGHHMRRTYMGIKSTVKESFYDLQLDVEGCPDVYSSFDKYVEIQDSLEIGQKGVLFNDFPPVLQLHLKRFKKDVSTNTVVKINDRYEFPLELDLDRDNGKYLSPDADKSVRNLYKLHSVLVHGGHYYSFIRKTLLDQWFKFDDERVTEENMKMALEEQYGDEEETNLGNSNAPSKFTKCSNACMLVYIRESNTDEIICDIDDQYIAENLKMRLMKEQEEKDQACLYTIIKVASDTDMSKHIGNYVDIDLVDHEKVQSFRVKKDKTFNEFKMGVFDEFGIPVAFQRFWIWTKRPNHTYCPSRSLTVKEETRSVGQFLEVSNENKKY